MKKKNKRIIIGVVVIALIILFGLLVALRFFAPQTICWPYCSNINNNAELEKIKEGMNTALPNPASVHCEEVGGTLDIRTDASGGQTGYCVFPDKSECEEWALLRNECVDNSVATANSNRAEDFRNLNIKAGDQITSPLKIIGEVKGGWFFEGSFPIDLVDWDGRIIATGLAAANSEWMTAGYVSFTSEIKFTKPANPTNQDYAKRGAIIFKADNPSGLPIHDKAYELSVSFK